MEQNYTTLVTLSIIEEALKGQSADQLLNIVNTSLRAHEKEVFAAYFGIGCPKQDLEAIAQATGCTLEQTEAILSRLLLKIRKHPDAPDIWKSIDEDSIIEKVNREIAKQCSQVQSGTEGAEEMIEGDDRGSSLPEQFHFSAGAHGACAYRRVIDREQMERCWQHAEYQCACKECGSTAYVYGWAGNCTSGGYWQIKVWCRVCNSYHDYHLRDRQPIHAHWTKMKDIIESEEQKTNNPKDE